MDHYQPGFMTEQIYMAKEITLVIQQSRLIYCVSCQRTAMSELEERNSLQLVTAEWKAAEKTNVGKTLRSSDQSCAQGVQIRFQFISFNRHHSSPTLVYQ